MPNPGLRLKISALWLLVNVVLALFVGILTYRTSRRLFRDQFLDDKLSLARTLADAIDGQTHSKLTSPDARDRSEYQKYMTFLNGVKNREDYVTYLYTVAYHPESGDLVYVLDADITDVDILWLESDYFALWGYYDGDQFLVGYDQDEHRTGIDVEVRDGVTVPLEIRYAEGMPSLWLAGQLMATVTKANPLVVATPAGEVSRGSVGLEWSADIAGEPTPIVFGHSAAGESTSVPGSLYVESPGTLSLIDQLIHENRDYVDREEKRGNYGELITAYAIIRDESWAARGLLGMDFLQNELRAFESRLQGTVMAVALTTFGLVLGVSLLMAQYLLVPIRRLRDAFSAVSTGDLSMRLHVRRRDEFGVVETGFNDMVASVQSNIMKRKDAESKLSRLAYYDQLTELPNRKSFQVRLDEALAAHRREDDGRSIGLLFLDLDHFKNVNDTLGHQVGDHVLHEAARRIRDNIRQNDIVFRLGGDEFTVLLTGLHTETDPAVVAEKLIGSFAHTFEVDGNSLHLGLSVGIALYPRDGANSHELIRSADTALFEAKKERGRYRFFTPAMQQRAFEKLGMINMLHTGIEGGEFDAHYQPIVDRSGTLVRVEALLRWHHPDRGMIAPDEFLDLAEETGLIVPLGNIVIDRACQMISRLMQLKLDGYPVAVNLSVAQLRDEALADYAHARAEALGDPETLLEFEITESGMMRDSTAGAVAELRGRGFRFSIDDFGTGFSSLSRLRRLPVHGLKIDRSFVMAMEQDPRDKELIRAVVMLAHAFGLEVCAEGIETREQFEYLSQVGCDLFQGYLFSPALTEQELITHLSSSGRNFGKIADDTQGVP